MQKLQPGLTSAERIEMQADPTRLDRFSIVIPTLQRSPHLRQIILDCCENPDVQEVIVINNAGSKLELAHSKLRVVDPGSNIFVNPAWNLGVALSTGSLVALVNDDVLFEPVALSYAAHLLRTGRFGIVGPDRSCFYETSESGRVSHRIYADRQVVTYGTFMCLRRESYAPVPGELKIWGGDEWLIKNQRRPNVALIRCRFSTDMGTTSSSTEFAPMKETETARTAELLSNIHAPWHLRILYTALWGFREIRARMRRGIGAS